MAVQESPTVHFVTNKYAVRMNQIIADLQVRNV